MQISLNLFISDAAKLKGGLLVILAVRPLSREHALRQGIRLETAFLRNSPQRNLAIAVNITKSLPLVFNYCSQRPALALRGGWFILLASRLPDG
jgi:hypothetical protein